MEDVNEDLKIVGRYIPKSIKSSYLGMNLTEKGIKEDENKSWGRNAKQRYVFWYPQRDLGRKGPLQGLVLY